MTHPAQARLADATAMTRLPAWLAEPAPAEHPRLAWSIDATSGRPVGRWLTLPGERPALS